MSKMQVEKDTTPTVWKASFDPHRQIVFSKYFLRGYVEKPRNFTKSFLNELIELHPEDWMIKGEHPLFRGFCTIKYTLMISFQARLKYVQRVHGRQLVTDVHKRLKEAYETTLTTLVGDILSPLDGNIHFVDKLPECRDKIVQLINTELSKGDINCSTRCELETDFDLSAIERANFTYQDVYTQIKRQYADFEKEKRGQNAQIESDERNQIAEIKSKEEEEKARIAAKAADEHHLAQLAEQRQTARHAEEKDRFELQNKKKEQAIQREKIDNLQTQSQLDREEAEAKAQGNIDEDLLELEILEKKAKNVERRIAIINTDIELLKAENEKARVEEWHRVILAEAEQKLREIDIEIEGLRIRTGNAVDSERVNRILEVLPKLVEEANRHPQPIEHLSILQTGSPPAFSGDQNGSANMSTNVIGPAVQLSQSILIIKEVLKLLSANSLNSE